MLAQLQALGDLLRGSLVGGDVPGSSRLHLGRRLHRTSGPRKICGSTGSGGRGSKTRMNERTGMAWSWSDEARVMLHPAAAYEGFSRDPPRGHWLGRPAKF